ncbi:hypothetical protein [Novacetimonas pomaceti]|uniref:hypothetical protein n=1 Tax=Novacetimonas pomaceti TaxID=2021998 RepID=UPI001C2D0A74|nr:hypothetical protein [Novacetimonas pomaceti]MBV1834127.1 hypothetical protein [Novacetimonas pomaceti]
MENPVQSNEVTIEAALSAVETLVCDQQGSDVNLIDINKALDCLAMPLAKKPANGEVVLRLMDKVRHLHHPKFDHTAMMTALVSYVEQQWSSLRASVIQIVTKNYAEHAVLEYLPCLQSDEAFIEAVAARVADHGVEEWQLRPLLLIVRPLNIEQARLLLAAGIQRARATNKRVSLNLDILFASIGQALEWKPWISLHALIFAAPDLAGPFANSDDVTTEDSVSEEGAARQKLICALVPQDKLRNVGASLLEVVGPDRSYQSDSLLSRPVEVKAAFVETIQTDLEDNELLRQAVIEALLWAADGQSGDFAQFTATALAQTADQSWIASLGSHPERLVRFAARAIRAAVFGERMDIPVVGRSSSLLESLVAIEGGIVPIDEPSRTWLGDRSVEQLIERTVSGIEARFARDYVDHGEEGEDRLLAMLFQSMSDRFRDLDQAFEALARAASATHRTSVAMTYRAVDRAEEGASGIKGAKSLSADLCLIIDPWLNGKALGRRAILIQAKRLYRNEKAVKQPAWHGSYGINQAQTKDLLTETDSSVFLFQAPPLAGRGVPVMPTQLVSDLALAQTASGTRLNRDIVAYSSRSLADWLTYDALALRIGDPYADLLRVAAGRDGARPRRLLDLPTVEITVKVAPSKKERR